MGAIENLNVGGIKIKPKLAPDRCKCKRDCDIVHLIDNMSMLFKGQFPLVQQMHRDLTQNDNHKQPKSLVEMLLVVLLLFDSWIKF